MPTFAAAMELDLTEVELWLVPVLIVAGALLIGWIIDRFILNKLRYLTSRTSWVADDIIIDALHGYVTFWFFLLGCSQALAFTNFSAKTEHKIEMVLLVLSIFTVTIVIARIAKGLIGQALGSVQSSVPSTSILGTLAMIVVYLTGILIILQRLGISITPILTTLGVGGLAVALALQDTLSNLFAGIQILINRQLRPGDYVRLEGGEEGWITDINLRNTTLRQMANNMVIIPNFKLADSIVTNYHLSDTLLSVIVQVGVSYDSNLPYVEQVALEVAKATMQQVEGGAADEDPVIRYKTFGDSSINFIVILKAREFFNQFLLQHEFVKNLKARFDREGIDIPFPIRTVYMKGQEEAK